MGTRFCATVEAPIHENIKAFLVGNDQRTTNIIFRRFHNTGRVARNAISDEGVALPALPETTFEDIRPLVSGARGRVALESGDLGAGLIWLGQVQGLIRDIPTCEALVARIVAEAEEIIVGRLSTARSKETAA